MKQGTAAAAASVASRRVRAAGASAFAVALGVALAAASCQHQDHNSRLPPTGSREGATVSASPFPNVHARLHLTVAQPGAATLEVDTDIWLFGERFHVRDSRGRAPSQILGELTYPRGTGTPLRTMEELMDRASEVQRAPHGVTELYGDLATDRGLVLQPLRDPSAQSASSLAPAATQLLADGRLAGLTAGAETSHLGRKAVAYRGVLEGQEEGRPYRTERHRLVAAPYVLLDEARDAASPQSLFLVREVTLLEEGGVTEADVTPPAR
jgi:hypothetical protein